MKKLGAARDYACLKLPVCLSKRDCLLGSMMGICLFLLGYCCPAYSEETPEDQADKMHTLSVSIQQHSGLHLFVPAQAAGYIGNVKWVAGTTDASLTIRHGLSDERKAVDDAQPDVFFFCRR